MKKLIAFTKTNFETILKILGLISILYSMGATQYQIAKTRESEEKELDWNRKIETQAKIDNRSMTQLTDDIKRRRRLLKDSITWVYSDSALRKNVRIRLNYYESLARGIKIEIYDESVVKMSLKSAMLQVYKNDYPLIDSMTKKYKRQAWSEFSELMERWKKDNNGDGDDNPE